MISIDVLQIQVKAAVNQKRSGMKIVINSMICLVENFTQTCRMKRGYQVSSDNEQKWQNSLPPPNKMATFIWLHFFADARPYICPTRIFVHENESKMFRTEVESV